MPKTLSQKLKESGTVHKRQEPLWKGPSVDGITQSLLSRFLCCRERFRLLVVEGLKPADHFSHRLEYGNMWHLCEECFAIGANWEANLKVYATKLCQRYPLQQEQVDQWYRVCRLQFPMYVEYWKKQPDVKSRTPLLQEETFKVPYTLPSGRVVLLRGKWDSVDLIGNGKTEGVYIQENKTKGDIDESQLARQLRFDLQTMMYFIALQEFRKFPQSVRGVRYNVIRRPLSGGRGTIRRHQATKNKPEETKESFYRRLEEILQEDPSQWFMRWKVEISNVDVARFKKESFDPILENLVCWWDHTTSQETRCNSCGAVDIPSTSLHYRLPYGIYNPLLEGGSSDLDEYLDSGSEVGLQRVENLFPELA